MRRFLAILLCLWAVQVSAQSTEDDRDFITGLIEDSISSEDLTVRLENFQGALSAQATADAITLADKDGIWLRVDGLTFSWDRSALLSGRVEVETLKADRIELIRMPPSQGSDMASAEATPFTLPELPVAIDIAEVTAREIVLTEALLGEPVTARFDGSLHLEGGSASAQILLERTDSKTGRFDVDLSYVDDTRQLAIFLAAEEGANGIAARLLNLPDRPALRLDITGDALLDDFIGNIALATNGVDRVSGTVALSRAPETRDQIFAVNLNGDVRPLLASQYDPFFGTNSELRLEGTQLSSGGVRLSNLIVATDLLVLRGAAQFDAQGWPESIDLRGRLGRGDGTRVLLPLPGTPTEVRGMSLNVTYDVNNGDAWTGAFDITSLAREGIAIDALALSGGGVIVPGAGARRGRFSADLSYAARGLTLDDPALSEAIGSDIEGTLNMGRLTGEPFVIRALTFDGAGLTGRASAYVQGPDDRFATRAQIALSADDFTRFAALSGLDLSGAGAVELSGTAQPFDGIFDLAVDAQSTDLAFGIAQVDPLLIDQSTVSLQIERDTEGTRINRVEIASNGVTATGRANITATTAQATFNAALTELNLITPDLSGPATLAGNIATDAAEIITLDTSLTAPRAQAGFVGTATPMEDGYTLRGDGQAALSDLSAYRALVGQPIGGSVSVDVNGTFETATRVLAADVNAQTRDLRIGSSAVDSVLAGLGRISADVGLSEEGRLRLDALDIVFPNLTAQGNVTTTGADTLANLSVRLRDIAVLVSDFSGPVVADITARQDAGGWQISGDATGPVNTAARTTGRVSNSGDLDLSVTGSAPLALANVYIAPRQVSGLAQFDLTVQGPAALSSLRGPVRIENARLAVPNLRESLENINGTIAMAGGTARIDLAGQSAAGGDVTLSGPVDLAPPFQAALIARLDGVVLRDATLYRAVARGEVTVNGPLTGGAQIGGAIGLSDVEIRVPSTGVSALGTLPEVTHLGIPMDVRATLDRAGVNTTPTPQADRTSGPDFPMDLLISAPSRVFVRGRGLDAELGGQLRLTGSTSNIIPIGRFDLVRGRLSILGQRFDLDEGFAQLQGDFMPFLRLVATTEASTGTIISIVVEGPADDIDVRFESSPELPQDEVLAQLLFGRDLSSISPLQAVQLASAVAKLAGRGGVSVVDRLRTGLNLDDLDFTTAEDGTAAVRAGKYISDNVYTDVTVGADGTTEINLNIDIDRNFTARGSVASDGETSVGIFFERDY